MRKIGVHTSIAGGLVKSLQRVEELQCNTMQIFSHNPRGWSVQMREQEECIAFRSTRQALKISPLFIHTSYLINLASGDAQLIDKSLRMVMHEMDLADSIGADYVVMHTGSASGDDQHIARNRAIACLTEIAGRGRWKSGLLLENTAGRRGDITSRVEDLAEIINKVPGTLISGVCIDTCHAFSAGYDLRSQRSIEELASSIRHNLGTDKVRLIHLNDSKSTLGSRIDRHEHIGRGNIGLEGIRNFVNYPDFSCVPLIIETPKKTEADDPRNLSILRRLARN